MRILINGQLFDSTETPILIIFDENEKELFNGMERYVSAPNNSTTEERQKLIDTDIDNVKLASVEQFDIIVDDDNVNILDWIGEHFKNGNWHKDYEVTVVMREVEYVEDEDNDDDLKKVYV